MEKDKGKQEKAHHNFLYLIVSPRLILGEQCNMFSRLYYRYSVTYSPGYIRQAVYLMKYLAIEHLNFPLAFSVY
jgi:hypothetical protein